MYIYSDSTPDLVDKVFGKIMTVRLTSFVLLSFLHSNLLTVELDGKEFIREQWPEACACAASSAGAGADSTTWCEVLDEGTEHGVEIFFNVVGLSAYIVAMTTGVAEEKSESHYTIRYSAQFTRTAVKPDFPNTRNASGRPDEFLEIASPLRIIKERFPFILNGYSHVLPDIMDPIEDSSQTRLSTASNQTTGPPVVSDSTMSIRDEMVAFAASLEAGFQPYASPQVEQVLCEYSQRCFLDLPRVCAPEVLLSGVMNININPNGTRTVMQRQRRSQPWLRSLWSLAINEDELGLFRADAAGLQKYTFDRLTGSGVIQSVQVALGITVATNEELGIHPAFSFREAVSKPLSESGQERTVSNADAEMPPYKKAQKESSRILPRPRFYRYKECVYKEVLDEDRGKYPQADGIAKTSPLFVGPFALKMYSADVDHEAYKFDLVQKAIEANVRYVVLPKQYVCNAPISYNRLLIKNSMWYLGKVVQDLRPGGYLQMEDSELDDREEIMMISPFKRTLAQFSDADEFYSGLIDALKGDHLVLAPSLFLIKVSGIESLTNAGLMHCDVSIDNILLEAEPYPASNEVINFVTFTTDGTVDIEIALLFQRSGSDGGLHDLDLLERVSEYQKSVRGQELAGPVPSCCDPSASRKVNFEYPKEVKDWAADESAEYGWSKAQLFAHVNAMKTYFFERQRGDMPYPPWYLTAATQSLPFWKNNFAVHRVFLAAFHENLWRAVSLEEGSETVWVRRGKTISPRKLIDKLEGYEGVLRDMLKGLK
ncbi:hypothetical protein C0995_014076 [Termitomyces sp. Mi166|nr:hypothetical protein C0995_014076 [Termitomyces sp. Mi166\